MTFEDILLELNTFHFGPTHIGVTIGANDLSLFFLLKYNLFVLVCVYLPYVSSLVSFVLFLFLLLSFPLVLYFHNVYCKHVFFMYMYLFKLGMHHR